MNTLTRLLFKSPVLLYRLGLGGLIGRRMLLRTTGRRSGLPRLTPLEYIEDESTGVLYIFSAWGRKSDWYRNMTATPRVEVRAGHRRFLAVAEPVRTIAEAAAAVETYRRPNPKEAAVFLRWVGLSAEPTPQEIERIVSEGQVVAVLPRE